MDAAQQTFEVNCPEAVSRYSARYYDPQAGRFLSEDPTGFNGDGTDFYSYVLNSPISLIDPLGLQHWGAPDYNPGLWNDPPGSIGSGPQLWNNCFSYAWNKVFPPQPGKQPRTPQPGDGTKKALNPYKKPTCKSVKEGAIANGFKDLASECGDCPPGYHKVRLYVGEHVHEPGGKDMGPDYHWYRLDSNGMWSSKHGQRPVGPQVSDPNGDAKSWGYDQSCGAMCAPN